MPVRRRSIKRFEHLTPAMSCELKTGPGRSPAFPSEESRRAAWFDHREELFVDPRTGEKRTGGPLWAEFVYELGGLPDDEIPGADGSFVWASRREMAEVRAGFWAKQHPERTLGEWREHWGLTQQQAVCDARST